MDTPADLWEQRYASSDRVWSGLVNHALADIARTLTPGRALDLGCGEGGDAVWLGLLSRPIMLGLLSLLGLPTMLGLLGPPALPASGSWSATSRASRMSRRTISSPPASCSPRSRSRGS